MNETHESETDTTVETTSTPLSRKAIILAGTVAGIIIAGGFAYLKKDHADEELVISEEIEIEIDDPDTTTDQN